MPNKLKELRQTLGYTQLEFAKILGVRRTQIAMYENYKRKPHISFCVKLKDKFDLSYKWIGEWVCEMEKMSEE